APSLPPRSDALVKVENLVREFGVGGESLFAGHRLRVSAVAGVSFEIRAGETFGLVGESGCGKSTISRIVAALDRPTSGTVTIGGENLLALSRRELRARRRNVHLMFQDPSASMDARMRVAQVLREPLEIQKLG